MIRSRVVLAQLHERNGMFVEASEAMGHAIAAMRLMVPDGWPELVELEERRGDLLVGAVNGLLFCFLLSFFSCNFAPEVKLSHRSSAHLVKVTHRRFTARHLGVRLPYDSLRL